MFVCKRLVRADKCVQHCQVSENLRINSLFKLGNLDIKILGKLNMMLSCRIWFRMKLKVSSCMFRENFKIFSQEFPDEWPIILCIYEININQTQVHYLLATSRKEWAIDHSMRSHTDQSLWLSCPSGVYASEWWATVAHTPKSVELRY